MKFTQRHVYNPLLLLFLFALAFIVADEIVQPQQWIVMLKAPFEVWPTVDDMTQITSVSTVTCTTLPSVLTPPIATEFDRQWQMKYLSERLPTFNISNQEIVTQYQFTAFQDFIGFTSFLSHLEVDILRTDTRVLVIEPNQNISLSTLASRIRYRVPSGGGVTLPVPSDDVVNLRVSDRADSLILPTPYQWGLDRINQRALPLDNSSSIHSRATGQGVTLYIIDTGLTSHEQLPSSRFINVANFADDNNASDCNGHGSHVAGTVAGETVGVAPKARVRMVKVLNCQGRGTTASVIAGLNFVMDEFKNVFGSQGSFVASLSLGGPFSESLNLVANNLARLMPVVVAAGNSGSDLALSPVSPATATGAGVIVVGASTIVDDRASYSNYGSVVDVFAPGSQIVSSYPCRSVGLETRCDCATCYMAQSGTSMATPHVSGTVALLLEEHPRATSDQIAKGLKCLSTPNVLNNVPQGTTNNLLYNNGVSLTCAVPTPVPTPVPIPMYRISYPPYFYYYPPYYYPYPYPYSSIPYDETVAP